MHGGGEGMGVVGGRDLVMWVFLLCNALRNIGNNPLNVTVARGISCFCLYDPKFREVLPYVYWSSRKVPVILVKF